MVLPPTAINVVMQDKYLSTARIILFERLLIEARLYDWVVSFDKKLLPRTVSPM